jgi:hypothetical protein
MAFVLGSSALTPGRPIPIRFTCDGDNVSPPLAWSGSPPGARAFALVMDDPDAPGGTFTHWLLCDLPATRTDLDEGAGAGTGTAGVNGFGRSRAQFDAAVARAALGTATLVTSYERRR